jgi:hypothetical protein
MKNSKNLPDILKSEPRQLPLKGFLVEVESKDENWRAFDEMTMSGRLRIHRVKKSAKPR